MKFPRQPVEEVNVNLTPLIDVVFLLLIFFMVSTTFRQEREFVIDLPEAESGGSREQVDLVEIAITADGQFLVNDEALAENSKASLMSAIMQAAAGDTSLPLVISADAQTPHQYVITAMDAAGQSGFTRLTLPTKAASQ